MLTITSKTSKQLQYISWTCGIQCCMISFWVCVKFNYQQSVLNKTEISLFFLKVWMKILVNCFQMKLVNVCSFPTSVPHLQYQINRNTQKRAKPWNTSWSTTSATAIPRTTVALRKPYRLTKRNTPTTNYPCATKSTIIATNIHRSVITNRLLKSWKLTKLQNIIDQVWPISYQVNQIFV